MGFRVTSQCNIHPFHTAASGKERKNGAKIEDPLFLANIVAIVYNGKFGWILYEDAANEIEQAMGVLMWFEGCSTTPLND